MGFKSILVHCDADKTVARRLDVATALASRVGARLVGLHVRAPFAPPFMYDASFGMDQLYQAYEDTLREDERAATKAFDAAILNKNIAAQKKIVDGYVEAEVTRYARYADLTILGQSSDDTPPSTPADLPAAVTMHAGRPTLIVPSVRIERQPGKVIMVCWNGTRESALAAAYAMPLLKQAERVILLSIAEDADETKDDISQAYDWLSQHGVKSAVQREPASDLDAADLILSRAADLNADLIVMGLYGHARTRELVLGGASRTMLSSMTVPLFTAH